MQSLYAFCYRLIFTGLFSNNTGRWYAFLCFCFMISPATITQASQSLNAPNSKSPESISIPAVSLIEQGSFVKGSDKKEREKAYVLDERAYGHSTTRTGHWYENEASRQTSHTDAYYITRTVITNSQYRDFISRSNHNVPNVDRATWESYGLNHNYQRTRRHAWRIDEPPPGRDDHPVVLVSYNDAVAYAEWLSRVTGDRWRLPTENEWEKAARGTDGRHFPWGNTFDTGLLNSHDSDNFDTTAIGQFPLGKSPYGLLDAAGQVYEWTSSQAGPDRFIVKGGSWDDKGCGVCRPAARHSRPRALKHIIVGFRVVKEK